MASQSFIFLSEETVIGAALVVKNATEAFLNELVFTNDELCYDANREAWLALRLRMTVLQGRIDAFLDATDNEFESSNADLAGKAHSSCNKET